MTGEIKTKEALLKHYSRKSPRYLKQYDIFTDPKTWDSVVTPNSVWMTETYELMNAPWSVRVLVDPKISNKELIKALDKIKSAIKPTILQRFQSLMISVGLRTKIWKIPN